MSLSLLAAGLGSRTLFALGVCRRLEWRLEGHYIALAAVHRALDVLEKDATEADGVNEEWSNNEALFSLQPMGGGSFTLHYEAKASDETQGPTKRYGFLDEERKINLNTATGEVLAGLLKQAQGLGEAQAREIADAILDWRDEDHDRSPYGAENFYYLGLDPSYECKDGPFENVEELLLVRGVTPGLYAWLAPRVTVYGAGGVNLNTADGVALQALGLSKEGAQGIVFYRAGEDNKEATADDRTFSAVSFALSELKGRCPDEDLNLLAQRESQKLLTVSAQAWRLTITAQTQGGGEAPLEASGVVDRSGQIRFWSER